MGCARGRPLRHVVQPRACRQLDPPLAGSSMGSYVYRNAPFAVSSSAPRASVGSAGVGSLVSSSALSVALAHKQRTALCTACPRGAERRSRRRAAARTRRLASRSALPADDDIFGCSVPSARRLPRGARAGCRSRVDGGAATRRDRPCRWPWDKQGLRYPTGSAAPKPTLHGCCDHGYGLSRTHSTWIAGVTAPLAAVPGPGAYPICGGDRYS